MANPYARFFRLTVILGIIIALNNATWAGNLTDQPQGENNMAMKTIREVLNEHSRSLMSIEGVVSTGQGLCQGKPCIIVFVVEKTPEIKKKILEILQRYPVMIEETGRVRALPENRN